MWATNSVQKEVDGIIWVYNEVYNWPSQVQVIHHVPVFLCHSILIPFEVVITNHVDTDGEGGEEEGEGTGEKHGSQVRQVHAVRLLGLALEKKGLNALDNIVVHTQSWDGTD